MKARMLEPMKTNCLFPGWIKWSRWGRYRKLDELLIHVADYCDSEIDYTLARSDHSLNRF